MKLLSDFISLIYPHLCVGCGRALQDKESLLCTYCNYDLPQTNFHLEKNNQILKLFWGKAGVEAATAMYFFNKGGKVQRLIHQLKYKGNTEVGSILGKRLGLLLRDAPHFEGIDVVIPVPLHPKKERQRGYNQSHFIAQGVAEGLGVQYFNHLLLRSTFTESQTKKSLFDRWKNVETVFQIEGAERVQNKTLLLVDDVVTTGSTLEACTHALLGIPGTRVLVATLASA